MAESGPSHSRLARTNGCDAWQYLYEWVFGQQIVPFDLSCGTVHSERTGMDSFSPHRRRLGESAASCLAKVAGVRSKVLKTGWDGNA